MSCPRPVPSGEHQGEGTCPRHVPVSGLFIDFWTWHVMWWHSRLIAETWSIKSLMFSLFCHKLDQTNKYDQFVNTAWAPRDADCWNLNISFFLFFEILHDKKPDASTVHFVHHIQHSPPPWQADHSSPTCLCSSHSCTHLLIQSYICSITLATLHPFSAFGHAPCRHYLFVRPTLAGT